MKHAALAASGVCQSVPMSSAAPENNIGGIFGKIDAICPDDKGELSLISHGERVFDFEGFSGLNDNDQ